MRRGDAGTGGLAGSIAGFGRALRRAGVPVDSARIAMAVDAVRLVGVESRDDLEAALEAVLIGREQDRALLRELFDAWFRAPALARERLDGMPPHGDVPAGPARRRPRVQEALAARRRADAGAQRAPQDDRRSDAAMTASRRQRLRHADFNALDGEEYRLVGRLAREVALPVPEVPARRTRPGPRGSRPHWPGAMHEAARTGGELLRLPRRMRMRRPLPLLVLVDVSGSMERYARLLLAFLHAATRRGRGRRGPCDVFAFGTHLTDLTAAFRIADTDTMLEAAGQAIDDFAGGTRLGESLAALRTGHARRLVGRRTLVLLVTDGLDTGEPDLLQRELGWLRLHSRRLLWLNPLLRFAGYEPLARGAAVLHGQADGMLAVHNIETLEQLAAGVAAVLRR